MWQALREHEAQLRAKSEELEAARRGETDGEREAKLVAATVQSQADMYARWGSNLGLAGCPSIC